MFFVVLIAILIIFISFFSIQILSLFWILGEKKEGKLQWFVKEPEQVALPEELPMVSILLAARNEEKLILRCLNAIEHIDYPKDKIEILIGDDMSTDRTAELVNSFILEKSNYTLFSITQNLGKGRGKANVLAHLAHKAKGEYFFITDVDVSLPPQWVKGMLRQFRPGVAIASGYTICEKGSFFANMQSIDWMHFMGYIKAFARVGVSSTSVGNNMAVLAKAYWETGGYENIDFSITEDYKLFKEVTARGWKWSNDLDPDTLGLATYIPQYGEMLHQRKRWLIGARELPWNWKGMILLYGLFIPALLVLFFVSPGLALLSWFTKLMIQSVFISMLCVKLKQRPFSIIQLYIYEIYVLFNTLATALFFILPIKAVWKGRTYNKTYLEH